MEASAFPKENARILSEEMNVKFGNFWKPKEPQSQTAGAREAQHSGRPPIPAQVNSEPWPGQPCPPRPIATSDPLAVTQRPAHSASLRGRAEPRAFESSRGPLRRRAMRCISGRVVPPPHCGSCGSCAVPALEPWRPGAVLEHVPLLLYILAAKTLILCLAFAGVKIYQRKRLEAKQQKLEAEKKKQSEKKEN
uniref:Small integral membrane protein 11 n=1 Tax=Ailuropoda melanoleuca TaxID=9646 RepID=A0A7N5JAF4_AILME